MHTLLITLSLFMTGASGLVVEYVLSTVSSYILGSSIEQFSITIAVMLGMMGVGGYAQKHVSSNNLIDKFIYLELLLALISGMAPILAYASFSYAPDSFTLVYYFFVVAIGFLVGFEIPFITRINESYSKDLKNNLSVVFAADYIGALVGAVIWVYLLLPYISLTEIGFLVASANLTVAVLTYFYFKRSSPASEKIIPGVLVILVTAVFAASMSNIADWSKIVEQKMFSDPVVESVQTKYQKLVLTHNQQLNDTRLYINGNTQFSSLDESRYHDFLVHLPVGFLNDKPSRVLILGGGDGLALKEVKRYPGVAVDIIELDKEMINLSRSSKHLLEVNNNAFKDSNEIEIFSFYDARDFLSKELKSGVNIFYTDANNFINAFLVNHKAPVYDLVIIDLPDPYSLSVNKLYTKQFYSRIKALLKPEGVLVTQATSPFHAKESFLMIGRTLEGAGYRVKPYRYNIPSFGEWGWWIASQESLSFKSLKIDANYITNELALSSFSFGKGELDSENNEINSLMRPVLMQIYSKDSWKGY